MRKRHVYLRSSGYDVRLGLHGRHDRSEQLRDMRQSLLVFGAAVLDMDLHL